MVTIRPYAPADDAACRALWVELTQHHRDLYAAQTIGGDDPGGGFDDYLARPERKASWVAEDNGEVVGLAGLLVTDGEGEVEPVVVAADRRGSGIGVALVDVVVKEARGRGLSSLSVRPVARNAGAIGFFREAGFNTIGHVELFMPLGGDTRDWRTGVDLHGHPLRY